MPNANTILMLSCQLIFQVNRLVWWVGGMANQDSPGKHMINGNHNLLYTQTQTNLSFVLDGFNFKPTLDFSKDAYPNKYASLVMGLFRSTLA